MRTLTTQFILNKAKRLLSKNSREASSLGKRLKLGLSSYVGAVKLKMEVEKKIVFTKEEEEVFKEATIEASVMERNPNSPYFNPNL